MNSPREEPRTHQQSIWSSFALRRCSSCRYVRGGRQHGRRFATHDAIYVHARSARPHQLLIPSESAHDTIEAIGRLGKLQFKDLNENQAAFSKTFASQVKRCDEMKRQLGFIQEQVEKAGLPIGSGLVFGSDDRHVELDVLESRLGRLEKEIVQLVENSEQLERSYHELHELQLVLETAGSFFDESRSRADTMDDPYSRESTFMENEMSMIMAPTRHDRSIAAGESSPSPLPTPTPAPTSTLPPAITTHLLRPTPLTHRRLQPIR